MKIVTAATAVLLLAGLCVGISAQEEDEVPLLRVNGHLITRTDL